MFASFRQSGPQISRLGTREVDPLSTSDPWAGRSVTPPATATTASRPTDDGAWSQWLSSSSSRGRGQGESELEQQPDMTEKANNMDNREEAYCEPNGLLAEKQKSENCVLEGLQKEAEGAAHPLNATWEQRQSANTLLRGLDTAQASAEGGTAEVAQPDTAELVASQRVKVAKHLDEAIPESTACKQNSLETDFAATSAEPDAIVGITVQMYNSYTVLVVGAPPELDAWFREQGARRSRDGWLFPDCEATWIHAALVKDGIPAALEPLEPG